MKQTILIMLSFFLSLSLGNLAIAKDAKKKEKKIKTVFVTSAVKKEISDTFIYPARIIPKVNAAILSESQGVVSKLQVGLGDKVKKNANLVLIRHSDPVYQYKPLNIKTPVNGVVSNILVTEGTLVAKGERLMTITAPDKYHIRIEITASDLSHIKKGTSGKLLLKRQDEIDVVVKGVSPFVDPGTGTATAELDVTDKKNCDNILLGQIGKTVFKSNVHNGYIVATDSVYYRGKKTFLKLVEKGKIKEVQVKLGAKRREKVEIIEGLVEGNVIVTRSSGFLADGDEVKIEKQNKI